MARPALLLQPPADQRVTMRPEIPQYGPPASRGWGRDFLANLASACRALCFLPARPGGWRPFSEQIVLLAFAGVAVAFAYALADSGWEGSFSWNGVPRQLLPAAAALFAGWLVSKAAGQPSALPLVATIVLSVLLLGELAADVASLAESWWDTGWSDGDLGPGTVLFAWCTLALCVAVARAVGGSWRVRLGGAGWALLVVVLPLWFVPYAPLWEAAEGDRADGADAYAGSREDVIYAQPRLLDHASARLARQRPGIEDLYFVGAAGDAGENVFLNEVSLAADLMRTRFDADGRIVVLSNNAATVRTLPVASATSLERALDAVAATMDVDEDILFLFVTTHGSEDHRLSMAFWPLQLEAVDPVMLKRMLDKAGIKWRVVALSACYAGGFIETLKDSRTLIMTAADADHPSFGCGADSDLTYFGKAYFDEALRQTYSFVTAFERARDSIAQRERAQDFDASNPDIFVGEDIRLKLDRLARRMEARALPQWRQAGCAGGDDAPGRDTCGSGLPAN